MSPSRPFILRPVATSLLMAAILLVGIAGYQQLPVSALPEVDYPTIQVLTFFPGASPDVMASAVTAPLERQFGQVPGLSQMTSSSSDGCSVITLQFTLELNIDLADTRMAQKISQLPGVGLVSISGGQKPAVRIQANPSLLASVGMNMEDLRTTIGAQNVNQAK